MRAAHRFLFTVALGAWGLTIAPARADDIPVKFLKDGRHTVALSPERPARLLIENRTSHRFRCTHFTQGLRVVVTPPAGIDVNLQVEHEGRPPRPPLDLGGPGAAERYEGHPPLGQTTLHVRARSGAGDVVVAWTWDPRCNERGGR